MWSRRKARRAVLCAAMAILTPLFGCGPAEPTTVPPTQPPVPPTTVPAAPSDSPPPAATLVPPTATPQNTLPSLTTLTGSGGGIIAFVSYRDGNAEIYVVNTDGNGLRRLTRNRANDWWPAWSPDGTQIAFISERDGNREVYLMDPDGKNQQRLTHNSAHDEDPTWRPAAPVGMAAPPQEVTFAAHTVASGFVHVSGIYVADFDGDGDNDILGATLYSNEVDWWRNDGGSPIAWTKQPTSSENAAQVEE